jgi:hypothetical protein
MNIVLTIADAVHVAKRKRQGFSNWFLWVDDVRINLVQLRELSAVRNRDRRDVESVLQISATAVTDVLKTNAAKVTHTVVPDFDCQCIEQVKAFLGTNAQTQGPQGTVSSVVVEDERRILIALGEIRGLFQKYAPQLLKVFKLKSLLTLVVENFFSEMRAGAYDMPMQLQFDFRFSRAMKEHLKQMCTTKFSYYTSAKSHYPRVKSELKYSTLPKMAPPSATQLTKPQVQQMRDGA